MRYNINHFINIFRAVKEYVPVRTLKTSFDGIFCVAIPKPDIVDDRLTLLEFLLVGGKQMYGVVISNA